MRLPVHLFRTLLPLILAAIALSGSTRVATADDLPPEIDLAPGPTNIVLIVADDLGYGDLGCYGAPDVDSPVLDGLARSGIRFTQFYSNGPECSPTRTALMTGRYQQRVGGLECAIGTHNVGRYDDAIRLANEHQLGLPPTENRLVRRLKDAGYTCGLFGKWHLGYEKHMWPLQQGFDRAFGCLGGNVDYFRHTENDGWNTLFDGDRLVEEDGYMTDLITDAALEWYQSVKNRPFFLYVPYTAPHSPIQVPGEDTGKLTPLDEWNRGPRHKYAAMVEHMDRGIGRILEALQEDNLERNTLVIFMSDNGADANGRNAPWTGNKGGLFEGGIRVPCIVRWPGRLPEGQVVNHPAITMDFTVSMLRAAEGQADETGEFDGIDILQQIEEDRPVGERTLFWRARRGDRTWKAVRSGSLKRIWKQEGDRQQKWMFDLEADPREQQNLLDERPEDARRLAELHAEWEQEVRAGR